MRLRYPRVTILISENVGNLLIYMSFIHVLVLLYIFFIVMFAFVYTYSPIIMDSIHSIIEKRMTTMYPKFIHYYIYKYVTTCCYY